MESTGAAARLNVLASTDHQLLVLYKEQGVLAARQELIMRYQRWRKCLIGYLILKAGLQLGEIEDAQQEAVLWTLRAINAYRIGGEGGSDHFRPFLTTFLGRQCWKYIRKYRRSQAWGRATGAVAAALESGTGRMVGGNVGACDPAQTAAHQEEEACLFRVLEDLLPPDRQLMAWRTAGSSFREMARALGITLDQVKWRWYRLQARLRKKVARVRVLPSGRARGRKETAQF
jgi:RNA polymerase sigma factor (sigma-70 family)